MWDKSSIVPWTKVERVKYFSIFNHNVGSTFLQVLPFSLFKGFKEVFMGDIRVMGGKESGGHLAIKMNEDGGVPGKKGPTGLVGEVPLHLGLMEVEKVMKKMEGIQLKPPPAILLPVFL